jgi:homoserine kinase
MLGANELLERPFTQEQILQFATEKEGHPDNVGPALYGNLVLGIAHENGLLIEQYQLPPLKVAVVLPDFHLLTSEARQALPQQVTLQDAIFNASRTPMVIQALQTAAYDKLAIAMQDKIHQPYRIPLIPGMAEAFTVAKSAGAKAVALSGAGPSLIAFAENGHDEIVERVTAVFTQNNLQSRAWILDIDPVGAQINDG